MPTDGRPKTTDLRQIVNAILYQEKYGLQWEVVKRPETHKFVVVVPKRWVVDRSISWTMNWRSLCRQYDYDLQTAESKIVLSPVFYLSARLTESRKVLWEINEEHERELRTPLNNITQNTHFSYYQCNKVE